MLNKGLSSEVHRHSRNEGILSPDLILLKDRAEQALHSAHTKAMHKLINLPLLKNAEICEQLGYAQIVVHKRK